MFDFKCPVNYRGYTRANRERERGKGYTDRYIEMFDFKCPVNYRGYTRANRER